MARVEWMRLEDFENKKGDPEGPPSLSCYRD